MSKIFGNLERSTPCFSATRLARMAGSTNFSLDMVVVRDKETVRKSNQYILVWVEESYFIEHINFLRIEKC